LVGLLSYIDFSDDGQRKPGTDEVVRTHKKEGDLIARLNAPAPEDWGPKVDLSYTNTDLHSEFVVDLGRGIAAGVPLRYYWTIHVGPRTEFRLVKEFRTADDLNADYRKLLGAEHQTAIDVFRLAAVFRAFQADNPDQLVSFINDAVARREAR
jgi:hypothetical protein